MKLSLRLSLVAWSLVSASELLAQPRARPDRPAVSLTLPWRLETALGHPIGFAGPFVARIGGRLVLAGGACFPDGPPWDGHPKRWFDRIATKPLFSSGRWRVDRLRLPGRLAYGVTLQAENSRAILIGGCDAKAHSSKCWSLHSASGADADLKIESYPALPMPLAYASGRAAGRLPLRCGGPAGARGARATRRAAVLDLRARAGRRLESYRALAWAGSLPRGVWNARLVALRVRWLRSRPEDATASSPTRRIPVAPRARLVSHCRPSSADRCGGTGVCCLGQARRLRWRQRDAQRCPEKSSGLLDRPTLVRAFYGSLARRRACCARRTRRSVGATRGAGHDRRGVGRRSNLHCQWRNQAGCAHTSGLFDCDARRQEAQPPREPRPHDLRLATPRLARALAAIARGLEVVILSVAATR